MVSRLTFWPLDKLSVEFGEKKFIFNKKIYNHETSIKNLIPGTIGCFIK